MDAVLSKLHWCALHPLIVDIATTAIAIGIATLIMYETRTHIAWKDGKFQVRLAVAAAAYGAIGLIAAHLLLHSIGIDTKNLKARLR